MIQNKINIVLFEPEIPSNTGNIARTASVTGVKLHLVKPLGFSLDDKYLKRAGLDYWEELDLEIHENINSFFEKYGYKKMFFITKKTENVYTDMDFTNDEEIFLIFGKETKGIPEDILMKNYSNTLRIPMLENMRSLNLSNSVVIVLYEVLRQKNFKGLMEGSNILKNKKI